MTAVAVSAPELHLPVFQDPLIDIKQLSKRFPVRRRWRQTLRHPRSVQQIDVLRAVTLQVWQGEIVALVGPNGAGKSTLFRLLSTLIYPDGGTATIAGYDLLRESARVRASIGLVNPDERSLNWRISASENLRFYAALHGLRRRELQHRVEEVMATVELTDAGDRMVGTYSSGMRQRLLIARALLAKPQVLLLDEPTRSLDPVAAQRFRRFLRDTLWHNQRCTVMLATHNTDEALDLCDRAVILHHGRVLAVGAPSQLLRGLETKRFQIRTRTPEHAVFTELERAGAVSNLTGVQDGDGWTMMNCEIRGGENRSAGVLRAMVLAGAEIGSFTAIQPALADVLEHEIHRSAKGKHADV